MKTQTYCIHENSSIHTKMLSILSFTENEAKWKRISVDTAWYFYRGDHVFHILETT